MNLNLLADASERIRFEKLWRFLLTQAESHQNGSAQTNENSRILREMISFIRQNFEKRLNLQSIAAAGGICKSKCCKLFQRYLHQTPNDYLNSLRLERAAELLRESNSSITQIALSCGFHSGSYFTELFSQKKGCTPTSYRQQLSPWDII